MCHPNCRPPPGVKVYSSAMMESSTDSSCVFVFQRPILGEQLGMGCSFVIRHRCRIAGQRPQAVAVAAGQVECDFDPLPALNRNRLSLGLEFFRHQPIEQGRVCSAP